MFQPLLEQLADKLRVKNWEQNFVEELPASKIMRQNCFMVDANKILKIKSLKHEINIQRKVGVCSTQ